MEYLCQSVRQLVCKKNLDHLYTGIYALWIIWRLSKPTWLPYGITWMPSWPPRTSCPSLKITLLHLNNLQQSQFLNVSLNIMSEKNAFTCIWMIYIQKGFVITVFKYLIGKSCISAFDDLSSEWVFMCLLKWLTWIKTNLHQLHLYDFQCWFSNLPSNCLCD